MALEVSDSQAFQRREWRVQRLGWTAMALLVVAALIGLLGPGPLSSATAVTDDGLAQVEYQRFGHLEADDALTVVVAPAAVTDDSVDVELAADWVRSVDISSIVPEPQEQVATPYGLRLTVAAEPGSRVTVQIAFRAMRVGVVDAGFRFDGQTVPFQPFVYP
jgi:hypothetical protein